MYNRYKKKVSRFPKRRAFTRLNRREREQLEDALSRLKGGRRRINEGIQMIEDLLD